MLINKASSVAVSRRRFLRVAGLSGLATAISACSSSEPGPVVPTDAPQPPAPAPTIASEPTVQTGPAPQLDPKATRAKPPYDAGLATAWIALFGDPRDCDWFDNMAEGFAADNSGLRINATVCDGGNENLPLVWKSRMADAQSPDAVFVEGGWLPRLIADNLLEPLDDLMQTSAYSNANAWPSAVMNIAKHQDKTYGLPILLAPNALYYNAGTFEKKGLSAKRDDFPKTWDEVRRISKTFTTWNGDTLQSAGYIPSLKATDLPLWFALNGGGMFDANTNKFVIDQERNIEILQFVLDWYRDEYRGDAGKVRNNSDFQTQDSFVDTPTAFQRGALAMTSGSIFASNRLSGQPLSAEASNWNVAPYPVGPSGKDSTTSGFTIWAVLPSKAKHRDDAFKYIDYVGGKGIVDAPAFDFGVFVPGNKTVVNLKGTKLIEQTRGEAFATDWLAFFLKQRDITTILFDASPIAGFAGDMFLLQIDDIVRGKLKAGEALRQVQKLCQDRLEQALKKS